MTCDRCKLIDDLVEEMDRLSDGPGLIQAERLQREHVYLHRAQRKTEQARARLERLEEIVAAQTVSLIAVRAEAEFSRRQNPRPSDDWLPMGAVGSRQVQEVVYRWWKDRGTWPDPFDVAADLAHDLGCSYEVASKGVSDALDNPDNRVVHMPTVVALRLGEAVGPVGDNDYFRLYTPEPFWPDLQREYEMDKAVAERVRLMETGTAALGEAAS